MQQLYFYVQEPSVLSHWSEAVDSPPKILFSLELETLSQYPKDNSIFLIQHHDKDSERIGNILSAGYSVILFANHPDQEQGFKWFQKGIKGYLNSYAQKQLIAQAIETVKANNIWLGQNIMQAIIQAIQPKAPSPNLSWQNTLTEREIQVANCILKGESNKEIATQLFITERTVKSHVHNLLEKFEVKDRLALVLKIQKL